MNKIILNRYKNKYPELQILITLNNPIVLCLQGTKLKPTDITSLKTYNIYRQDYIGGSAASRGVLLAISNNNYH